MNLNVYDWFTYKTYDTYYCRNWQYPDIKTKYMTQIECCHIPGFGDIDSTAKGYNNWTDYCDKYLTAYGRSIRDGMTWSDATFGTYLYAGGMIFEFDREQGLGEVIFRVPGLTCGRLIIADKRILSVEINSCAFGSTGIPAVYGEDIKKDLYLWWPPKLYEINRLEYRGKVYERSST